MSEYAVGVTCPVCRWGITVSGESSESAVIEEAVTEWRADHNHTLRERIAARLGFTVGH